MTAPTEADIREALQLRPELWPNDNPTKHLGEVVVDFASFLTSPAFDALENPDSRAPEDLSNAADDVWASDLRPSEAVRLREIAQEGIARATERAQAAIVDELVAAALRFAEEFPDAPRARVPVEA